MGKLVSPGYARSALIGNILVPTEERILMFRGLNRKDQVSEGEMTHMKNLTGDNFPLLTPRMPRGTMALPTGAVNPIQIISRFERIAMIAQKSDESYAFFYNNTEVQTVTGLTAESRMVAINTKICFFPQKTYVEIVRTGSVVSIGSFGNIEAVESVTSGTITLGASNDRFLMNSTGSAGKYKYDDAVNITGTLTYTDKDGVPHTDVPCEVSCIIEQVDGANLYLPQGSFIELTAAGATTATFTGTVERKMPTLNVICEWNNRLWGASNIDNTIYACKLGDPTNWTYYQGTNLDSYYAQQGTDEDWTGIAAYSEHLICFKQNSMTRVYGTGPSNYQIQNAHCYGVEQGSKDSVVVINNIVYYKSTVGIMAYGGGNPYDISDKLNCTFSNVVAGTEGKKYYASIHNDDTNTNELMVFDIDRAMWFREDDFRFRNACTMDGRLYVIPEATTITGLTIINPETATESASSMQWEAVFGPFDEYIENRKIYSRILMRLLPYGNQTTASSAVNIYISIDGGEWELVKACNPAEIGGDYIPIIPRRCDRYSIKVTGTGECKMKSLTRKVRKGTVNQL